MCLKSTGRGFAMKPDVVSDKNSKTELSEDIITYFDVCEPDYKKLKINLQQELTTYLNYSLPLCAILWDHKKLPWLYEHFIQLYSMKGPNGYLWLDYLEELYFPLDVAEYKFIDSEIMKNVTDIKGFIKDRIDNGYCSMIFFDEFYLSGRRFFNQRHKPLQIFIYGYDDIEKTFLSIGFTPDFTFTFLKQPYEDLITAYEAAKSSFNQQIPIWVKLYTTVLIKVKEPLQEYHFNMDRFLKGLKSYLFCEENPWMLRPEIRVERGEKANFGMSVYDDILHNLGDLLESKQTIDYRQIHLLYEHKKMLNKKLLYISSQYHLDTQIIERMSGYKKVLQQFELVRNIFMKHALKDNDFKNLYGPIKDKATIHQMTDIISRGKEQEKALLSGIYEGLEKQSLRWQS